MIDNWRSRLLRIMAGLYAISWCMSLLAIYFPEIFGYPPWMDISIVTVLGVTIFMLFLIGGLLSVAKRMNTKPIENEYHTSSEQKYQRQAAMARPKKLIFLYIFLSIICFLCMITILFLFGFTDLFESRLWLMYAILLFFAVLNALLLKRIGKILFKW